MLFYRNILSQNLFTYLPCCFIVTFCHKICSPTYHAVLSEYSVFYSPIPCCFIVLPFLFYHILSQNLFTYLPCCFIVTFCHKIGSPTSPTYHAMLFYRNILSQNWFTNLPCCFIETFCHKICSPTYHAVLSFYRNILFLSTFCHKVSSPTYLAVLS